MFVLDYRPKSLNEMIGQDGIIKEMKKRSINRDFPQFMIFEGSTGSGKTTLANIVSALIVDDNPIKNEDGTLSPNLETPAVKAIFDGKYNRDVIFKNGALMGKDDIPKLNEEMSLAPRYDNKKVIIIDEAQEISVTGKSTLLTFLEKKRADSYLILCTMNIEKFDKAIIDRCAHYKFRPISENKIAEYLFEFTNKLNIDVNDDTQEFFEKGIFLLAENSKGSVRDAIQMLERCVYGNFWTVKQIEEQFEILSTEKLSDMIMKLFTGDKQVITDIKSFGSKEFYYKMMKTLTDAYLYQKTGYVDIAWKKYLASKMSNYDLKKIISCFENVDSLGYFKEDWFIYSLLNAFFDTEKKPVQNKSERIPI